MKEMNRKKQPKQFSTIAGVDVTIDPNNGFEGIDPRKLLEACGLLPSFIMEAVIMDPRDAEEFLSFEQDIYSFSMRSNWLEQGNGTIDDRGTYRYPDDPDMEPLAKFEFELDSGPVTCYVYQYGYFAVVAENFKHLERQD